jgi:hypothetical protein
MNSPVVDMQALWQKPEWKAQFEQIAALQSPWQKYLEGIQREWKAQFEQIAAISKLKIPTQEQWKALSESRKEAALLLAKRGWFIPLDMTLGEIDALFRKIEMGEEDEDRPNCRHG